MTQLGSTSWSVAVWERGSLLVFLMEIRVSTLLNVDHWISNRSNGEESVWANIYFGPSIGLA